MVAIPVKSLAREKMHAENGKHDKPVEKKKETGENDIYRSLSYPFSPLLPSFCFKFLFQVSSWQRGVNK